MASLTPTAPPRWSSWRSGPADRRRYAPSSRARTRSRSRNAPKQQATLAAMTSMLDTAGRLHIDQVLMDEVQPVRDVATPRDAVGRRWPDRPGRGERRHRIRRQGRHPGVVHAGWMATARRCGAVDAGGDRQADPLRRSWRKMDALRPSTPTASPGRIRAWAISSRRSKRRRKPLRSNRPSA